MEGNSTETEAPISASGKGMGKRLDAMGWGLFFIWVVAAIIFLGQSARKYYGLRIEKFWAVIGVLFLLGGIWELFQVQVGLVPILLIVAGCALLLSMFRAR